MGLPAGIAKGAKLLEGRWADGMAELEKLGRVFRELAQRNPEYFVSSRELPKGMDANDSAEWLANKHKIHNRHGINSMKEQVQEFATAPGAPRLTVYPYGRAEDHPRGDRAARHGQFNKHTEMYGIDASPLSAGSGGAKKLYPAAYEWLLAQPDAANITSVLTENNSFRRNLPMSGMLEKYGQRAADRLMVDEDQLRSFGGRPGLADAYHHSSLDAKLGLLNARSAGRTSSQVDELLREQRRLEQDQFGDPERRQYAEQLMRDARKLNIDPDVGWRPTTEVGDDYFPLLEQLVRQAAYGSARAQPVGVDSLRRAAIAEDTLNQGLQAADLDPQPWLSKGLARRAGGSVPGRKR